jgi:hypothetical protein
LSFDFLALKLGAGVRKLASEALSPLQSAPRLPVGLNQKATLAIPYERRSRSKPSLTNVDAVCCIEQASPHLAQCRLAPAQLPRQIERATRLLQRLQEWPSTREDVDPVLRIPVVADQIF